MFIIIKYKSELQAEQQQQLFSFFLYFIACPTREETVGEKPAQLDRI
jgi:hypothetical protein